MGRADRPAITIEGAVLNVSALAGEHSEAIAVTILAGYATDERWEWWNDVGALASYQLRFWPGGLMGAEA